MEKRRILVVDDDPVIRGFVGANLRVRNFDVTVAEDGTSALREIEGSLPDLVILDVMMPGIDGIEVCRRIREKSDVPVIMISAKVDSASQAHAKRIGADSYICKPFAINDLVTQVQTLLGLDK